MITIERCTHERRQFGFPHVVLEGTQVLVTLMYCVDSDGNTNLITPHLRRGLRHLNQSVCFMLIQPAQGHQ